MRVNCNHEHMLPTEFTRQILELFSFLLIELLVNKRRILMYSDSIGDIYFNLISWQCITGTVSVKSRLYLFPYSCPLHQYKYTFNTTWCNVLVIFDIRSISFIVLFYLNRIIRFMISPKNEHIDFWFFQTIFWKLCQYHSSKYFYSMVPTNKQVLIYMQAL